MVQDGSFIQRFLSREPIFHRREIIWDETSFDREIADEFSEITASGRPCSRDEVKAIVLGRILDELPDTHPDTLGTDYRLDHAVVRRLGDEVVQVRYTLHEACRVTRRSTLYRVTDVGWQAVFHQGTVVAGGGSGDEQGMP